MKLAGIDAFLTQKISWSQFNRFPHNSFLWEGLDGTRIFTHFPPSDTYNGNLDMWELCRGNDRYQDHGRLDRSLYVYGHGDGGGGPTRGMLENARRLCDFDGVPKVTLAKAQTFFDAALNDSTDLLVWSGELYLEFHRGTFTTQAFVKRANRTAERLLREAEMVDAADFALGGPEDHHAIVDSPPRAIWDVVERPDAAARNGRAGALDRAWKLLLLNQFHDIIPGSSTGWVYRDARRDFDTIETLANAVASSARTTLLTRISSGAARSPLVAWNDAPTARAEVTALGDGRLAWLELPSFGYGVIDGEAPPGLPTQVAPVSASESPQGVTLDNGMVRYTIDRTGTLSAAWDHRVNRAILANGENGNRLQLHPDRSNGGEAWDIDAFDIDNGCDLPPADSVEVVEQSPLRAAVRVVRSFGTSRLEQTIVLRAGSARLDFVTTVDWHERQRLLKVGFPLALRASHATYEIPFGHVARPTHRNTSWDMAQFEVCAHRWAHLGEPDYGVALLNDCKYGYDCHGSTLRLSLLRGPLYPDPNADAGPHTFTYAILPHPGTLQDGGVVEEGYRLNHPVRFHRTPPNPAGPLPPAASLIAIDRPGVFVSALKVSEDGDAVVLRLYEGHGTRGRAVVRTSLPLGNPRPADLVERSRAADDTFEVLAPQTLALHFTPFQIHTVMFDRRDGAA
jgi:alpha-mannosidase